MVRGAGGGVPLLQMMRARHCRALRGTLSWQLQVREVGGVDSYYGYV